MTACQRAGKTDDKTAMKPARWKERQLARLPANRLANMKFCPPTGMIGRQRMASGHARQQDRQLVSLLEILLASLQSSRYGRDMIIVIANSKGGVGKSTLAVHLTAWLSRQGHKVTLADCDTQQSSSEWIREAAPNVKAVRLDNPDIILNELPLLRQDADYVVADGPGSQTETSRALSLRAHLAIVPCKASMLEVRALAKATEVLRQAQDIRNGKPQAIIVLSMVGKNYRLTQDMKDAAEALNLSLAGTVTILRQIYADASGQGATVWNLGACASQAAHEVEHLFREILPQARKQRDSHAAQSKLAS